MDEIGFKVKKASKIIDNLIKAAAFLSFLLFMCSFYIYYYKSNDFYKSQVELCDIVWSQGLTDQNPLENPLHETFLKYKNNCFNKASRTTEMWGTTAFISLAISLVLPLVYFGSKKVVLDSAEKLKKVHTYM